MNYDTYSATPIVRRINMAHADLPKRMCADCAHALCRPIERLGVCPLFGFSRFHVELRCPRFVAKPKVRQ